MRQTRLALARIPNGMNHRGRWERAPLQGQDFGASKGGGRLIFWDWGGRVERAAKSVRPIPMGSAEGQGA